MRSLDDLNASTTACVRFVDGLVRDEEVDAIARDLSSNGIVVVKLNCLDVLRSGKRLIDELALRLGADHAPYGDLPYIEFEDDMVGMSREKGGMVLLLTQANALIEQDRNTFFRLIEVFLRQSDLWLVASKPCHLCFFVTRPERRVTSSN